MTEPVEGRYYWVRYRDGEWQVGRRVAHEGRARWKLCGWEFPEIGASREPEIGPMLSPPGTCLLCGKPADSAAADYCRVCLPGAR